VIIHAEPVEKAGGAAAGEEERPAGRSKRKRGAKAAAPAEPELPAASDEQRRAASAAIAAIHRAASGEKGEEGPDGLDELASGLVAAAIDARGGLETPAANEAEVEVETGREVTDQAFGATPEPSAAGGPAAEPGGNGATPARRRRRVASRPAGPPTTG
jgi:ribonuclease E